MIDTHLLARDAAARVDALLIKMQVQLIRTMQDLIRDVGDEIDDVANLEAVVKARFVVIAQAIRAETGAEIALIRRSVRERASLIFGEAA